MDTEKDGDQPHEESPVNTKHLDESDDNSSNACSSSLGGTGLLSLPWELVSHIASHLPAQCIITVLPKVCLALGNVSKDTASWQIRAHRLTGSRANFPVGPKEDFDWSTACVEMEQLINLWTDEAHKRQSLEEANIGEEQEGDEVEGIGVEAQEVAYGADEGLEVAMEEDNQEIPGNEQEDAAALINEERNLGPDDDLYPQENENPRLLGNDQLLEKETKPALRPSPSPALECITLASDHIAQVNSVLLVGGKGRFCATASRDWNVQLWDLEAGSSGVLLRTLGGQGHFSTHKGWVWCLASQGPLLASGGFDSGTERGTIKADAPVLCLAFQNNMLLAGTFDKRITMYDPRAPEPLVKSLNLHGNAVIKDCTVALYDCRAGKGIKKIHLKSYPLSISYSGSEVWAGDSKGMLHTFSMQAGTLKVLSQFDVGHTAMVTGIHRSLGSLYTCSADRTVKVHIPCSHQELSAHYNTRLE
ncbi:hypothetical protein WMY93_003587 [Mugilogobius chulae]|uniref:F-box/WD repeat-containing protein 9 n=1 Tax=Mugilogobius chulae TaxID=88201 RepID=A0AAW0Q2S0_9GOBI